MLIKFLIRGIYQDTKRNFISYLRRRYFSLIIRLISFLFSV